MAQTHARRAAKQRRRVNRNKGGRGPTPPRFGFGDDIIIDAILDEAFGVDRTDFTLDPLTIAHEALQRASTRPIDGRPERLRAR